LKKKEKSLVGMSLLKKNEERKCLICYICLEMRRNIWRKKLKRENEDIKEENRVINEMR